MMLDVFKGDAFSFTKLVDTINKIPYAPTRLGSMGLFEDVPVSTLTVAIESQDGVLTLVPTAARGVPGPVKNPERRKLRQFATVHLPQRVSIMADEVQGLRAYGSETEETLASNLLNQKVAIPRRDLDITHEFQRMGALKGVVLDADGSTIYDYRSEFGVSASTATWALGTSTTKVLQLAIALKRQIEDTLGGIMMSGVEVLCSAEFFDAFTSHPAVIEAYKFQMSQFLRSDNRDGFEFGGITWSEYRGSIGGTRFIGANKAYAVPKGVPGLFKTYFSPAPYMETVNTLGLPFYMKMQAADWNVGVDVQMQSNPLHMCTRPDAIVELTAS